MGHTVRGNLCCDYGAPAHLLLLHEQLKEDGLVPLVLDAAYIRRISHYKQTYRRARWRWMCTKRKKAPTQVPAAGEPRERARAVDITGREHVLRGRSALLGLQRESRGDRPTDVTGSPRSLQKSLVFSGASAPCSPIRRAPKLFFVILLPPQKNTSASPDGLPERFRMALSTCTGGACGLRS